MISSQCDKLRERAAELRNLAPKPEVPYLVPSTKETMALAMMSAASEMEQAADLILELRDDLQRAYDAVQDAEHDESMAWDRVRKAEAEKCEGCLFEYDRYGCERKDMTDLDWLRMEVDK